MKLWSLQQQVRRLKLGLYTWANLFALLSLVASQQQQQQQQQQYQQHHRQYQNQRGLNVQRTKDQIEALPATSYYLQANKHQPSSDCADCLAIPLVALMGDSQLSGFLVPSTGQRKRTHHYPSFAPHSDEKCPMTGPLTVCDQVGSYPGEVILQKLENAKKILRQSGFNIDSLFTDERDHLSEPFAEEPTGNRSRQTSGRQAETRRVSPNKNDHYGRAVGLEHKKTSSRQLLRQPQLTDDCREQTGSGNNRRPQVNMNRSPADEFVELVERRAIRLEAPIRRVGGDRALDSGTETTDEYLTGRRLYRSAGVNASSLANRLLLSIGDGQVSEEASATDNHMGLKRSRPRRQAAVQVEASSGSGEPLALPQPDPEVAASGSTPAPEPVCRARSTYISPRAALNDKKQWKYVVNAGERAPQIRQIIRVDICENPFGPCSDQVTLPFGFTSQCKQKYSKKKLLALDAQSGLLEVDTFFVPSCCVCQLVRELQPSEPTGREKEEDDQNGDDSTSPSPPSDPPNDSVTSAINSDDNEETGRAGESSGGGNS